VIELTDPLKSGSARNGAEPYGKGNMRVLLIEDDSATSQSIELMLKSESFNVFTTDLGEEGADLGKLYDYDIILLDLNLPDMPDPDSLWHRGHRRQGQRAWLWCGRLHDEAIP
jgi:response regulator RpfG family c-di-GMP phosphodiesterase